MPIKFKVEKDYSDKKNYKQKFFEHEIHINYVNLQGN